MNDTTSRGRGAFFDSDNKTHQFAADLLAKADIQIDGSRPWDMRFNAPGVPQAALAHGNLGLGETYMEGAWDADELDQFFYKLLSARIPRHIKPLKILPHIIKAKYLNRQTKERAWDVGKAHYDLGNDFYGAMLDSRMTYTCGYWKDANNLEEAQVAKLDLICRKLQLQPGMRVLDIGCGWGSLMVHAAEHYGVEAVGITISKEQAGWATAYYPHLSLDFRLMDYRDIDEKFDRIASVGMFEHVGPKNYRTFMQVAHRCLNPGGLFLLHTIGRNLRKTFSDPWIDKYIFPNGEVPSIGMIGDSVDKLFVVEDVHNFGADYDKTLMAWHDNFEKAWPRFQDELGHRFYRMWRYYLLSCAGAFRARDIQLWQWVLSKEGVQGVYPRIT